VTRHSRFLNVVLIGATLGASALWPVDAYAQRRAPRHSSRVVVVSPRYYPAYYYPRYYYPRFYYPGWYGGYYDPFFFGYYGQYRYPYPPYYGGWGYDNTGSARLQVSPRNAQVYIDGYFAGVVDEFDGALQRLNVEAGEHELQIFLEGYQTFTQKVLFVRGRTLKIVHAMQPLAPGETSGAPPKPEPRQSAQPYRGQQGRQPVPSTRGEERSAFGSLLLRVRPSDAEVLVDGETWAAPENEDQFVIELAEGPHRIEVRKSGFQTYTTTVNVRRGQSVRLNVSLTSARSGAV
jgi:PEGA domain